MLSKQYSKGFTLIELMIAVAIVAILASIAIPSYQSSIKKSRRADAQGALMSLANGMERHYTESNTYCDAAKPAADGGAAVTGCGTAAEDSGKPNVGPVQSPESGTASYNLTIKSDITGSAYTLVATPTGTQAGNGVIELTSTGIRRWDRNNDSDFADTDETKWD